MSWDVYSTAIGQLCIEAEAYWRVDRAEEVQNIPTKSGAAVANLVFINLITVVAIMRTAFVMLNTRGERPCRRGESVLVTADNEAAGTWVRSCRGGEKKKARLRALMRMVGELKSKKRLWFQARMRESIMSWRTGRLGGKGSKTPENQTQRVPESLGRCKGCERGSSSRVGDVARGYMFEGEYGVGGELEVKQVS